MTFKEEIDLQIRDNVKLTEELLNRLDEKNYFSGRNKQAGDIVLYGMLNETNQNGEPFYRLITFHQEELGTLYEEDINSYNGVKGSRLPIIKKL